MATRKAAATKTSPAKKDAKQTAKKGSAPAPAKTTGAKGPAKKASKSSAQDYTNPELREKVKQEVLAGDKGGRAGQWSARKAQMVAHEYEAQGGGYKHPRNAAQKSLKEWGDEHWHTADGKHASQGDVTHRYLPDAAWKELSPEERKKTDRKKVAGSEQGKQFVANTARAAKARKHATESSELERTRE